MQDADAVGERECLCHVVGHEDYRGPELALDAPELVVQLGACHRVERAERLVHEQNWGARRERSRDANTLPLTTRQLARPPACVVGRRKPDHVQ